MLDAFKAACIHKMLAYYLILLALDSIRYSPIILINYFSSGKRPLFASTPLPNTSSQARHTLTERYISVLKCIFFAYI